MNVTRELRAADDRIDETDGILREREETERGEGDDDATRDTGIYTS